MMKILSTILILFSLIPAQDVTTAGNLSAPYPTVTNLAIKWLIQGDDNLNGRVQIRFRATGETNWRDAMPLKRVPPGTYKTHTWENKHSGSIFDLKPGTTYEIECDLIDPDGGSIKRSISASTRPVPRIPPHARIIDLPSGFTNSLTITEDGTVDTPLVYRSLDHSAAFGSVKMYGRQYVYLEGLVLRGSTPGTPTSTAIVMSGSKHCVVRRCSINAVSAVMATGVGIENCYISDNWIQGVSEWKDENMGAGGNHTGQLIVFTGPGNVICNNYVSGSEDNIGFWEETMASNQTCNDIYNNHINAGCDDAIEADYSMGNCRIMRNMITNSFTMLSSQPSLGGPAYFIRNVMYNSTYAPYKFHNGSMGNVVLHNTVIKIGDGMLCFSGTIWDYALFRNNLAIGGASDTTVRFGGYKPGAGFAANLCSPGPNCDFDYDAVGSWDVPYVALIDSQPFAGFEPHGIERIIEGNIPVSSIFAGVDFPVDGYFEYSPPDLRPKPATPVVDKGEVIPNINDGYLGTAPDCGAYESGQELPIYGPRPPGVDELTPYESGAIRAVEPGMQFRRTIQLYPNPFTNHAGITISIANGLAKAPLFIYDLMGRKAAELMPLNHGPNSIDYEWRPGTGRQGNITKGVYFIRINSPDGDLVKKAMVLR